MEMEAPASSREATPRKTRAREKRRLQGKPASDSLDCRAMKKDPANFRKLEETILVLGTGAAKKRFDGEILKKIRAQFHYFSDRRIALATKTLLRFGYLASRELLFSLLSGHPNKYLANARARKAEAKRKGDLRALFGNDAQASSAGVSRAIVEDFFFGERLSEKLQAKFAQPCENPAAPAN